MIRTKLLKLCWFLEDIMDKITDNKADWFWPSKYLEKPSLARHSKNRVTSKCTARMKK